ncbi:MAG: nucleotidyltransferase domain-containing protein [Humibacillus sp.]|nr:nucleotidyltransferase domain-containing protein [Humibacillus sp.]MDN5778316.1 nucleotidyltransferase domain-containing protein [Humibacillus sp.]
MSDTVTPALVSALARLPQIRAVFATGSIARGEADEYSDVDLLAVADRDDIGPLAHQLATLHVPGLAPVVLVNTLDLGDTRVLSCVTADWDRYDIALEPVEMIVTHTRSTAIALFDPDGLAQQLTAPRPPRPVDPAAVERLTSEFLRVLGLFAVGHGRRDWVTLASGAMLLRQLTISLFSQEIAAEDRGGMLHLRRTLDPAAYQQLAELPAVVADPEACRLAHQRVAEVFLPKARLLSHQVDSPWPSEFEAAVRRRLAPLGIVV